MPLPPRPTLPNLPKKVVPGGMGAIKAPSGAAIQAAKARVQKALGKLQGKSPLASSPLFQQYLQILAEGGPEAEMYVKQLTQRTKEEIERHRHLLGPLSHALRPFQSMQTRKSFMHNVLRPAQTRQLRSQGVWDGVDRYFANEGPGFNFLRWAETNLGPLTISLGVGAEVGAGGGFEAGYAIGGLRHHCVAVTKSTTVAVGAYGELDVSFQIGASQGKPRPGLGLTIDAAGGVKAGLAAEVTVSFAPSLHKPTLEPKPMWDPETKSFIIYSGIVVDYTFVGVALSLGLGSPGGGVAIGATGSNTFVLGGTAS